MFKPRLLNIYDTWLAKKDFIAFKDRPSDMKLWDLLQKDCMRNLISELYDILLDNFLLIESQDWCLNL